MGVEFVAIEKSSGRVGLILEGQQSNTFKVLWSDGSVSQSSMAQSRKFVRNSLNHLSHVSPERNRSLALENLTQWGLEFLWEARALRPANPIVTSSQIKVALRELFGSDKEGDKAFQRLRTALLRQPDVVQIKSDRFSLLVDDLTIETSDLTDWESLKKKAGQGASNGKAAGGDKVSEAPALTAVNVGDIKSSNIKKKNLWETYIEVLNQNAELSRNHIWQTREILTGFASLRQGFQACDEYDRERIRSRASTTKSTGAVLLSWVLFGNVPSKSAVVKSDSRAMARSMVFEAATMDPDLTFQEKSALAAIVEATKPELELATLPLSARNTVLGLLVSIHSSSLAEYVDQLVDQYAAALEMLAEPERLSEKTAQAVAAFLKHVEWATPAKVPAILGSLKVLPKLSEHQEIWSGVDTSSLTRFALLVLREGATPQSHIEAASQAAASVFLKTADVSERVAVLGQLPILKGLYKPPVLAAFIESALDTSLELRSVLSELTGVASQRRDRELLEETRKELAITRKELTKASNELAEARVEVKILESRVSEIRETGRKLRDETRQMYLAEAARALVKVLNSIEQKSGTDSREFVEVLEGAKSFGVSPIAVSGEQVIYNYDDFTDPDSRCKPGQLVTVLATGYKLENDSLSLTLQKARVGI